jgi:hypothetical protein
MSAVYWASVALLKIAFRETTPFTVISTFYMENRLSQNF